ncbi:PQQ-binding-like beta-propeller repeat protein [Patescibacteria group bacterium]|nr:PQQ-binding-like beta-propeller repeat protein [Patescibacteria group bacterium]
MSKSLNLCLIFLVAIFVIGSVFAGGPFISADDGRQRIAIFTDDGRCIWEYPAAKPYAAWVLPEDRVLLANGHGVELITADKQAVWTYSTKEEVFGVDLLPSGNVIVAECTAGQLVELDKAGKVVHTIKVNSKTAGHMNMRNVRVTPKDTFLVGHMGDKAVREYDRSGNMINEFAVPDMAYMGERLENGNTLVGHKGGVVEFNAKKDIVWQLTSNDLPVVLAVGGGTGAVAINSLIEQSIGELTKFCNIIHVTGKNKKIQYSKSLRVTRYALREFLNAEQMSQAYAAADIAVSRAGMGVLTELSYLGKPAILIPMPDSHQEDNAEIFKEKQAAIVLNQKELTAEKLVENIKKLLNNRELQNKLSSNIKTVIKKGANDRIVEIINNIIKKK